MKVLVINGSPKIGDKSSTFTITEKFLEGLNNKVEHDITVLNVVEKNIAYCKGCLSCWIRQDGHCVIQDDMNDILDMIKDSDMLVWSFPLYEYGVPGPLKTLMDRLNPFLKVQMYAADNRVYHETVVDLPKKKNVILCGCGFPAFEANFAGLKIQMKNIFINPTMVCICESGLVTLPDPKLADIKEKLFSNLRKAGLEYNAKSFVSPENLACIEAPMLPSEMYINLINSLVQK